TTFFFISYPPARLSIFASRETVCSSPFLPSYSAFLRQSLISVLDNASVQIPCAHAGLASPKPAKFCRRVPAASDLVPDLRQFLERSAAAALGLADQHGVINPAWYLT